MKRYDRNLRSRFFGCLHPDLLNLHKTLNHEISLLSDTVNSHPSFKSFC